MALISMKCPSCGGEIQIDESREFCFCSYCGNKLLLESNLPQKVKIDNTEKIKVWEKLAWNSFRDKNYQNALEFTEKILNDDPSNAFAWYVKGCVLEDRKSALFALNTAMTFVKDDDELRAKIENKINIIEKIGAPPVEVNFVRLNNITGCYDKLMIYLDGKFLTELKNHSQTVKTVPSGAHKIGVMSTGKHDPAWTEVFLGNGSTINFIIDLTGIRISQR